jgi:hypothetical protein
MTIRSDVVDKLHDHRRSMGSSSFVMGANKHFEIGEDVIDFHEIEIAVDALNKKNLAELVEFSDGGLPADTTLELKLVCENEKDVALLSGPDHWINKIGLWCWDRNIIAIRSPWKYFVNHDTNKGRYSNTSRIIYDKQPLSETNLRSSLLVSKNMSLCCDAWLYHTFNLHSSLGRILGYPSCCVRAFCDRWQSARQNSYGDVASTLIESSSSFSSNWSANFLIRYFGDQMISHFPCSLDCLLSRDLGLRYFNGIRKAHPKLSSEIYRTHRSSFVYTRHLGVAFLPDCKISLEEKEWVLQYDRNLVRCTADNALARIFSETDFLVGPRVKGRLALDLSETGWVICFETPEYI